jgi:iron(III) transport system substrate-binding protein
MRTACTTTAAVLISFAGFVGTGAPASAATPVETLYAELAKLPPEERNKKILEGVAKESGLVTSPNFKGSVGKRHTDFFRKRYPNIKLETLDMPTEAVTERVLAEETADRHLTDVLGVTVPDMNVLLRKDMVARYPTPATASILPRYKNFLDPENRWTPWYWSEHGVSYNSALMKAADAPKSYEDLCDARFKGQVSYEPGETKWLIGMYLFFGEEKFKNWLGCIAKNEPVIMKGHTLRMELMLNGDHMIQGDNFLYTGAAANAKNPKKAPFAIVNTAPVTVFAGVSAINTNTTRPYGSALWTDWQLTEESQKVIYDEFRGPLAMKHPFITDDTELFIYGLVPEEVNAKANEIWKQTIGAKR